MSELTPSQKIKSGDIDLKYDELFECARSNKAYTEEMESTIATQSAMIQFLANNLEEIDHHANSEDHQTYTAEQWIRKSFVRIKIKSILPKETKIKCLMCSKQMKRCPKCFTVAEHVLPCGCPS